MNMEDDKKHKHTIDGVETKQTYRLECIRLTWASQVYIKWDKTSKQYIRNTQYIGWLRTLISWVTNSTLTYNQSITALFANNLTGKSTKECTKQSHNNFFFLVRNTFKSKCVHSHGCMLNVERQGIVFIHNYTLYTHVLCSYSYSYCD